MSGHMKGPWQVIDHGGSSHSLSSNLSVGGGSNGMSSIAWLTIGGGRAAANARLIAAAPTLLENLKALLSEFKPRDCPDPNCTICLRRVALDACARAAVAAAEGT